jgi:hypothetical protein
MTELARLRRTYELDARVAPGAGAAWRGAAHETGSRKDGRSKSVRSACSNITAVTRLQLVCQLRRVADKCGRLPGGPSAPAPQRVGLAACGSGDPGGEFVAAVAWYISAAATTDKDAEAAGMFGEQALEMLLDMHMDLAGLLQLFDTPSVLGNFTWTSSWSR